MDIRPSGRTSLARLGAHLAIRSYQLTLSFLVGGQCRHAPSCSAYMDEAILRHGAWIGGWMGTARLWRCRPGGTSGYDPVPASPDAAARWYVPWRYGRWSGADVEGQVEGDVEGEVGATGEARVNEVFGARSGGHP